MSVRGKPGSINLSVLHAWISLSTLRFVWFLQRVGEEWWNSNRMGQVCWCSCCSVSYLLILVEKIFNKILFLEAAIQAWYEEEHTWEMKLEVFLFELHNFRSTVYFILELLPKVNSLAHNLFNAYNLLIWKYVISPNGTLYGSWLTCTVCVLLWQRTSLRR